MLSQVDIQELFFDVKEKPLKVIVDNMILNSKSYFSLSHKDKLIGIKPLKPIQKRLFISNKIAFESLDFLASLISSDLQSFRAFTNEKQNECVIFTGQKTDNSSKNKKEVNSTIKRLRKIGFQPALALSNGYDYDGKLVFYALLELSIEEQTYGYLTLSKFSLADDICTQLSNTRNNNYLKIIVENLDKKALPKFIDAYSSFLVKYDALKEIRVSSNKLVAITLDIYNKNRNIQAIQSDAELAKDLERFITSSQRYYSSVRANNLTYILNYIVRYQAINFSLPKVSEQQVNLALQEKKVYKNINRLFKGKNKENSELQHYIKAQVQVLKEVLKILG